MGNAKCNESHFSRGVRARTAGSVQIPSLGCPDESYFVRKPATYQAAWFFKKRI